MRYRPARPSRPTRPAIYGIVAEPKTAYASCMLTDPSGESGVTGQVILEQTEGQQTQIKALVTGLTYGSHGFHVHQSGDLSEGCSSAGGHFNPQSTKHGAYSDPASQRHVGDLKSLNAQRNGVAVGESKDLLINLSGKESVIGRAIVVHAGQDDLGRGGDAGSEASGNAGARVACCVIGLAEDKPEMAKKEDTTS